MVILRAGCHPMMLGAAAIGCHAAIFEGMFPLSGKCSEEVADRIRKMESHTPWAHTSRPDLYPGPRIGPLHPLHR